MATYRIQRGDTLSGLAQRHRTTVASLLKANPQIKNANLISVALVVERDRLQLRDGGYDLLPAEYQGRPLYTLA